MTKQNSTIFFYGWFFCSKCKKNWTSHLCWEKHYQKCIKCLRSFYPTRMEDKSKDNPIDENPTSQKGQPAQDFPKIDKRKTQRSYLPRRTKFPYQDPDGYLIFKNKDSFYCETEDHKWYGVYDKNPRYIFWYGVEDQYGNYWEYRKSVWVKLYRITFKCKCCYVWYEWEEKMGIYKSICPACNEENYNDTGHKQDLCEMCLKVNTICASYGRAKLSYAANSYYDYYD